MQFLMELWIPILVGGLGVFVTSALVWMLLPHHRKEWRGFANEAAVADAIRAGAPEPGLYHLPHPEDPKAMGTPEFIAKMNRGPIAFVTVAPNGAQGMGPMMAKSAVMNIFIAVFVAYVAWHALDPAAPYLEVFRIVATVTFMSCAFGSMADSIWFGRPWGSWFRQCFDALLYAGVMGGVFGWLWG